MLNIPICILTVFAHVSLQKFERKFIFGIDINDTSKVYCIKQNKLSEAVKAVDDK